MVFLAKPRAWQISAMHSSIFFSSQFITSNFSSLQIDFCRFFIGFTLWDVDLHSLLIFMLWNKSKYTHHRRPVWTEQWAHCLPALFYTMSFVCCWQHPSVQPANKNCLNEIMSPNLLEVNKRCQQTLLKVSHLAIRLLQKIPIQNNVRLFHNLRLRQTYLWTNQVQHMLPQALSKKPHNKYIHMV